MNYFVLSKLQDTDTLSYLEFEDKQIPYKKHNGRRLPVVLKIPMISNLSITKCDKEDNTFKIIKEHLNQYTSTTEQHEEFIRLVENIKNVDTFDDIQFIIGKNVKLKGELENILDIFQKDDFIWNLKMFVVVREIKYKKVIVEVRYIEGNKEINMDMKVDIEDDYVENDVENVEDYDRENEEREIKPQSSNSLIEYSLEDDTLEDEAISLNDKRTTLKKLYEDTLEKAKKAQQLAQLYFNECERLREMYYELDN
jgi:hypothetical protein